MPLWESFLWRTTGGSKELIDYLQRILASSLTGMTREHALFFAYGTGANGKSVLISTVAGILAEYHTTAPIETFTASNSDRHPFSLADCAGLALSLLQLRRKAALGLRQRSRRLLAGIALQPVSCVRTSSSLPRFSSY